MRQVISDFIDRLHTANQSEQTVTISMREESDKIVRIFSDERYSIGDLAAILEDDITILLRELESESVAIERDKGNEYWESVHNGRIFMISGIMAVLIDRAAGVRVFLSDDFLLQHEDDIFLNTRFANYVRNEYKAKGKPQQKHIEAPQQPIGGNSGELAGNGNENAPEGSKQPDIKKEELPTIYDDEINKVREQQVFYNAIQRGWMQPNGTTYKWLKNKNHLALMCGLLYWGDEVKDNLGAKTDEWGEYPKTLSKSKHRFNYESGECKKTSKDIKDLFGGIDVSNLRSQLSELPDEYGSITRLFPTD